MTCLLHIFYNYFIQKLRIYIYIYSMVHGALLLILICWHLQTRNIPGMKPKRYQSTGSKFHTQYYLYVTSLRCLTDCLRARTHSPRTHQYRSSLPPRHPNTNVTSYSARLTCERCEGGRDSYSVKTCVSPGLKLSGTVMVSIRLPRGLTLKR